MLGAVMIVIVTPQNVTLQRVLGIIFVAPYTTPLFRFRVQIIIVIKELSCPERVGTYGGTVAKGKHGA